MIRPILLLMLSAAMPLPGVQAATALPETCTQSDAARTGWPLLARLDSVRTIRSDADSVSSSPVRQASGGFSEVETYIRFHQEASAGDARSRLMPWPEIRSLAP